MYLSLKYARNYNIHETNKDVDGKLVMMNKDVILYYASYSNEAPLPEGLCSVCHKGGHNRSSCQYGNLTSLPVEMWYHIHSFFFERTCWIDINPNIFEELIGSLFGRQEYLNFKVKEFLNKFLATEVFLQNFKTVVGKKDSFLSLLT